VSISKLNIIIIYGWKLNMNRSKYIFLISISKYCLYLYCLKEFIYELIVISKIMLLKAKKCV